ncbi:hypothetical protein Tco_0072957 [Tanacetum coccineum]
MAIAEEEPSVGKADARSCQWVEITMKKVHILLSMTDGDERKHVLNFTHVDLHYVEDQRKVLVNKFNLLKQELSLHKSELCNLKNIVSINCSLQNEVIRVNLENESLKDEISNLKKALGGRGKRKEKISLKDVIFTKEDESSSILIPEITYESESECETHEPLSPLPKLIGAEPAGTSNSLISLTSLTLNTSVPKMTKPTSDTVSPTHAIKKKTETKPPAVPIPHPEKKADPSAEQLLLMEEVKSLKEQIKVPSDNSPSIVEGVKQYLHRYSKESGSKVVFGDNSSGDIKGYGSVNCNGITFTRVTYVNGLKQNLINISQLCGANFKLLFTKTQETIFNQNDEVVLIAPRRRDVYVIDMSFYNEESNACFFAKALPSVN